MIELVASEQANSIELSGPHIQQRTFPHRIFFIHNLQRATHRTSTSWQVRRRRRISEPTANHLSELSTQLTHRTLSTANFQQQRTPSDSSLENHNSSNQLNMASVSNLTATAALLLLVAVQATPVTKQHQQPVRSRRAATARQDRLWDEAVIPYEIDPLFSNERASLFRSAMRHWENHTCVRFVERQPEEHPNYIVFTERSCGCCSFVGKRGNGAQAISIGKHCDKFGIVVHELGHVVGFWHEHTRPDRDQHVQIIAKNIMSGQEYNFNKLTKDEVNSLGLAYDYDSILHYATNTFAKDTYLDTILPLHGHLNTEDAANQTQPAVASTTAHIAPTPTSNTAASTGGPELVINEPNSAKQATNNTSAPHMINDDATTTTANLQQLQRDFESMLQYQPDSSHHRAAASQMVLLDGSVVVKLNNQPEPKQQQQTRQKRGSVDVEDGFHMLAMDNLLAKTRPEIGQRMRLSVGDIAQTNLLYKCPKCGRTIQQLSGTFQSPNYFTAQTPDKRTRLSSNELNPEIPPNQVVEKDFCEWRLTVGQGERIMINITDLDLAPPTPAPDLITHQASLRLGMPKTELDEHELHDVIGKQTSSNNEPMIKADCVTDYIEVRDGYTYRAPVIAKLCGHISSLRDFHRPIVSTGNRLLITYKTTSLSTGKRGFSAQHETLCGGYILLGNSAVIKEPIFQPLMPMPTPIETVRVDKVPAAHATSQNKIALNGSSPSENEVLLSSQTNLRYNNLQSQQPVLVNVSTDIPANDSSTATNSAQSSAYGSDSQKSFGWGQWPAMNMSYLQSPNWPELYRPNRECIWQIKAEENHQISMRFESFDLESHGSCAYDYLEIRDGDAMNSSLIGRYCGKGIPEQILSTNHSMMVKFVSDSDVNRGGFLATFQSELDECKLGTHGCSYRCSNAVVPYRCECPSDLELAPDGKSCVRICGGIKNETTGLITSPLFPDLYPISTKCIWEIVAPSHHRITLNFTHFDLEGIKAQECDYDYVDIRSRVEGGKYVKNGVFCGPNQALVVTSVANVMRIEFNSDSSIQKSGFQATYFIDTDECDTNNGGCQHICTNTIGSYQCSCNNGFILHENKHECLEGHCLYAITNPDGVFHSPNFPSTYQPNKECAWVFTTAPGHRIKLIFDQFDLESHQECAYDHVAVYDGETENDPALGRFCGSRRPLTLISSFNTLYLLFRSDATNEKRGFNASHTTVCGGRLLQANLNQNDLIYSHPSFDGTTHYSRNEDCEWRIEANFNQRVKIEFTFFALEADNNCYYDVVSIYDGAEDTDPQLARLCGTELTKDQSRTISSGESLLIVFKTDDSINNRGFSLTYTAIESNEDDSVAVTPTMSKYSQPS